MGLTEVCGSRGLVPRRIQRDKVITPKEHRKLEAGNMKLITMANMFYFNVF